MSHRLPTIPVENEIISDRLYGIVYEKFSEAKELYIAENDLDIRQAEDYLDSYSFDEKVIEIIKYLEMELACSSETIKHYQSKDK